MSITSKRKAQELVRQGKIHEAIEALRSGLAEGEPDPYDHVYLGDLLMRVGETESCLAAYQKAIRSYEDVGLFRNAVAIGKKMVRIDRNRPEVHRLLASLYDREGLHGEAIPHYLTYLDSFAGEQVPPTEFLDTLDQAASITGSKVEVALRLVEHFLRIRRPDRAAALLEEVANNAAACGSDDLAADLRHRAVEVMGGSGTPIGEEPAGHGPAIETTTEFETFAGSAAHPGPSPLEDLPPIPFETGSSDALHGPDGRTEIHDATTLQMDVELLREDDATRDDAPARAPASGDPFDFGAIDLSGASAAGHEDRASSWDPDGDPPALDTDLESDEALAWPTEPGDEHVYEIELEDGGPEFTLEPVDEEQERERASADRVEEADSSPEESDSPEDFPATASHGADPYTSDEHEDAGPDDGRTPTLDEAHDAFLEGRWAEARRLYERLLETEPENRRVLAKLVETVRYLQDPHAEVHYLVLLGEAWIAEDELEEALECFLQVVSLDPENATAKRRLSRFREMGVRGADAIEESDSNSVHGVLETGRSEVAVRSGEDFRSEDWVELEGLLEEFKDGLKSQMADGDFQGHYDLAVSYHGMGLLEEALDAADRALACENVPAAIERQARELKGTCLMELHRYREAVHEYREAVERAGSDRQARRTALYHLGRSLEALEEWQEAVDTYVRLKLEAPGFLDVEERMRHCEERVAGSSSQPPSSEAA